MIILFFILCGIVMGFFTGFFGIGGGIITVPLLLFSLEHVGVAQESVVQTAIFTSAAVVFSNALISASTHWHYEKWTFKLYMLLAVGLIFGSILGAVTLIRLDGETLQVLLSTFFLLSAYSLGVKKNVLSNFKHIFVKFPLGMAAFCVGWISALLGIGGTVFNVPVLLGHGFSIRKAISISAACAALIGLTSVLSSMVFSLMAGLPIFHYIYLPAFFAIALSAALFSHFGAKLTHRTDPEKMKRFFAFFLLLLGIYMVIRIMS